MRKFATEYPFAFTQQVVAQLTNHLSISLAKQPVAQIDSYEGNRAIYSERRIIPLIAQRKPETES